jgi:hypothetical protein
MKGKYFLLNVGNRDRLGPKSLRGNRFYKGTETLGKKPHITLTKLQFLENVFKQSRNPWKSLNFS